MNRGRAIAMVVLLAIVVVVLGVLFRPDRSRGAYRLGDSSPRGYSGLARVMDRLDVPMREVDLADVEDGSGDRIVFVPRPLQLGDEGREAVEAHASSGGLVVLGGPTDRPTPPLSEVRPFIQYQSPRDCTQADLAAVDGLDRIDTADLEPLAVPSGASSCFGDGSAAYLVERQVGDGRVVTLAGAELWVNDVMRTLDQPSDEVQGPMADNVVMAAAILAGGDAAGVDVVVSGLQGVPAVAEGTGGLLAHVPTGIKLAIWQGFIALAVFALVRGRRWGRVVDETLPVTIAGSELVEARAGLMERRRDPAHAAAAIRRDAVRRLGEDLGLGRRADPVAVATTLAQRTGQDPSAIAALLAGPLPTADADLIRLVHALDRLQEELHDDAARHPA